MGFYLFPAPIRTTPEPSHLLSNGIGDDQDNSNHLAQSETPDLDVGKSEQPKAETASAVTPILSWSMFGTAAHEAGQSDTPGNLFARVCPSDIECVASRRSSSLSL